MDSFSERFAVRTESATDPAFVVRRGKVRFSLLTERLLRVEVAPKGGFVDAPTQKVWYRNFAKPLFKVTQRENILSIRTPQTIFHYDMKNQKMACVTLRDGRVVTDFGKGNLKGTFRTLDGTIGPVPLGKGLISRGGVSVMDDSASLLLCEDGRILPREEREKDQYFFAYGQDYRGCIQDLFRLTGKVPLVPRYCLGNWWSRYKAYSQQEYIDLMERFLKEEIPITVATVDMDWHWVDVDRRFGEQARNQAASRSIKTRWFDQQPGWTGYSWNTELFPDYKGFLRWLQEHNFKVTLNLHPATGVRSFEDQYEEIGRAMGVDTARGQQVEFDVSDPKFMDAYFKYLHRPYEKDGVDFWWIDWQQGKSSKVKGLDPLWALNHYHYLDNAHDGKRPLILSRYAGVGSHRYPLGFSGDTSVSWSCLKFQPYFTANATNVGYTWWSHDIGGHHRCKRDDELYLRWVQFGVFSPIMRLHSTSNEFLGKEPWKFRWDVEQLSKECLRLRHRLIPYLYSMNWRTHEEGIALCEPMYYSYPERAEAYDVPNQYFFGSELIAAPITRRAEEETNLASVRVWLPKGRWTDIFNSRIYEGEQTLTLYRGLESIPVLAKEGAILPMSRNDRTNDWKNPEQLDVWLYRGNGQFALYEDDGETNQWESGSRAITKMELLEENDTLRFLLHPAQGDTASLPEKRELCLHFKDIAEAGEISVTRNGRKAAFTSEDETTLTLTVKGVKPTDAIEVLLSGITPLCNRNLTEALIELISKYQTGVDEKASQYTEFVKHPSMDIPGGDDYSGPIRELLSLWKGI